ncbi:unnamed protein product [Nippostrongylus brasiliensis]|uniref:Uncharacterized protein n=1 Tax=Nippostrongylus brasiliensis TaxID=27835 RepID=A0A0N4YMX3_NIPBR|nr:unnamed protein product [Nippostrongylus brasiliensis]
MMLFSAAILMLLPILSTTEKAEVDIRVSGACSPGVEITRPLRNLVAEVELRIGGTPNPSNPALPCSKKIDEKVNQCFCSKLEGSCCDEMLPGLYDIETEMCTPEIDDVKDYIPPEIQANILDKKPVSTLIYLFRTSGKTDAPYQLINISPTYHRTTAIQYAQKCFRFQCLSRYI